ncbi:FAD/FMN-containing isoamyl alcohol oxidase-like protein MreA [Corynespora cassiicola Philippines]|uniref:FAD/FMN-containing isoamyl alcohol oxidase-like protein MreA n=1 Tax=Corynespora cassiicola Philippines TaxID=1448308 RepID=A0A2T2N8L1_CORCC|nr:FAD/FMN-containing isoamyl alcohol oxidase-like protein MreA [Corynespora cassiicola Philippines]
MDLVFFLVSLLAVANCVVGAPWIGEEKEVNGVAYQCKCYSDNACWPSEEDWVSLNTTVQGTLNAALPPGAPCYNRVENLSLDVRDPEACAEVQANWQSEQWLTDHPIASLFPLYTNNTCLPTDNANATCTSGFYGNYVILATTKSHIKAGIDFAREHNLRLVIRNTGHDFMGRSTGFGSLIINTHSFKEVKFVTNYEGPGEWTGNAAFVDAGVQGRELYRQAFAQDPKVVIVGGECPTVGWGGGYIQGGGHGPLTSIYGMGADNVLSFDAITAAGEFVTANADENPDLFWALKGGGPGTFAVVTSITVKTFPEVPTAGTILDINSTHTNDTALFNQGFQIFHNLSNHFTEYGMFAYFELTLGRLHIAPFVGPNMDEAKLNEVLKPLYEQLDAAKVPFSSYTKAFPTFFELYTDMFEDEESNLNAVFGGRLFTQKDISKNGTAVADAIILASSPTEDTMGLSIGHIVYPGHGVPVVDNAIHPKWRNASSFVITTVGMNSDESWDSKLYHQNIQTNIVGKALREAGPNGAAYVNEGDLNEPNWQEAYWGSNYPKLLELRKKWDPAGVFYTQTTPGTEDWEVIDYGTKLCKIIS